MEVKVNLYEKITTSIVAAIEKGGLKKWSMPWHTSSELPKNVVTKKPYRGMNTLILWAQAMILAYEHPIWGTYRQWQELGAHVKKGEEASMVTYWHFSDNGKQGEEDTEESTTHRTAWMKAYYVFNVEQVEGYEIPGLVEVGANNERIPDADNFFKNLGSLVKTGKKACYVPLTDTITMPKFTSFLDERYFYSTLGHEHIHWTGANGRLDRELAPRFKEDSYAMEELVAELGAAFVCAHLGINPQPREDHASYIDHWLKVLKADSKAIFTAASKAQQAVDYMVDRQPARKAQIALAEQARLLQ
jgi:antirestriction protein ArdC